MERQAAVCNAMPEAHHLPCGVIGGRRCAQRNFEEGPRFLATIFTLEISANFIGTAAAHGRSGKGLSSFSIVGYLCRFAIPRTGVRPMAHSREAGLSGHFREKTIIVRNHRNGPPSGYRCAPFMISFQRRGRGFLPDCPYYSN